MSDPTFPDSELPTGTYTLPEGSKPKLTTPYTQGFQDYIGGIQPLVNPKGRKVSGEWSTEYLEGYETAKDYFGPK